MGDPGTECKFHDMGTLEIHTQIPDQCQAVHAVDAKKILPSNAAGCYKVTSL